MCGLLTGLQNIFDFVPFPLFPQTSGPLLHLKKKHFARLCNSPVTLHLSTPREALPSSWINFSHDSLKAAVIPAVCALFLPHFSLEVSYPRISLSTALCNSQPFLPCPCGRCQWSLSGELSSQQLGCVCMYWTRLRDRHYLYCVNSISLKMKSIFFFIKTWNISLYIWWMWNVSKFTFFNLITKKWTFHNAQIFLDALDLQTIWGTFLEEISADMVKLMRIIWDTKLINYTDFCFNLSV